MIFYHLLDHTLRYFDNDIHFGTAIHKILLDKQYHNCLLYIQVDNNNYLEKYVLCKNKNFVKIITFNNNFL